MGLETKNSYCYYSWFGFITGPCEQERLKVQYTAHWTFSMADSLTVGLTPRWNLSAVTAVKVWQLLVFPYPDFNSIPFFKSRLQLDSFLYSHRAPWPPWLAAAATAAAAAAAGPPPWGAPTATAATAQRAASPSTSPGKKMFFEISNEKSLCGTVVRFE